MTRRRSVPGCREGRQLGHGAAGTVVLVEHAVTGRPVAIEHLADAATGGRVAAAAAPVGPTPDA